MNGPALSAGVTSARCQHVVIGTAGLFYNPAVAPILPTSSLEGGERGGQKGALLRVLLSGGRGREGLPLSAISQSLKPQLVISTSLPPLLAASGN